MNRAFRLPSLFTSLLLLGACQQIIGLGDYEAVDEEEEEGGAAGKGGIGGKGGGTTGGSGGKGGTAGGSTGGSGGRGGSAGKGGSSGKGGTTGKGGTSGDAGEGGMGAEGGTGGATGGSAGTGGAGGGSGNGGSSGNAGTGGSSACPELTLQNVVAISVDPPDPSFRWTIVNVAIQEQLVGGADDLARFEFFSGDAFDGDATGTFELGTGVDDNYETCGRCLLIERDATTRFFATSGTMEIDEDSEQMDGRPILTISDVTLQEVEIDPDTLVSTVVQGGDCYQITNFSLELPTPAWNCPVTSWGDNICDCGCDEPDLECAGPLIGACEACLSEGSCAQSDCSDIDFEDNSQCAATNPTWDCPFASYGDGSCSCGCGSTDPDCANDYVGACDYCDEAGSCDGSSDCADITLDDNSTCTQDQEWTCPPSYYSDGGCDCGCGVMDIDCPPQPSIDTDCYCGTGSCATSTCEEIDPDDVSICL
jgi:hypothetical protein